jgi:hypothetical protein
VLSAPKLIFRVLISILTSAPVFAQLPQTTAAFNRYIFEAEDRIRHQRASAETFLAVDSLPPNQRAENLARLRRGELVIEKRNDSSRDIPGGLIHDWLGTAFIPGATLAQVLAVVRDHDHLTRYYSPDVMQSRIISRNGDDLHIFIRFRKHKVVTVVLDTEYDVHYGRVDPAHQYSLSRSTRVTEIADPGTPTEHAVPPGQDHGFMWRLNTYWAFEQANDGVLIECEAISLTRAVPTGLGWLIGPFVHGIPRESLQFTLNATRAAVVPQSGRQHP